eukprot:TRINITY_DN105204_c0_g1_i1.p1 TRINITY_DN105204_c0_g1~~TRINITY_DN105204_c0_g1_i1.p1  ORF type:complete len:284 (+),score=31.00 TRINITY_DN105204_c0_g1_i1:48-899(+)
MAIDRYGPFPLEYKIFDACGIPVYVHFFLIAFFAMELSNAEAGAKQGPGLPNYHKAAFLALMCTAGFVILFVTVLIHELGHCAGAKVVGGRVERILLWPLGGLAFCSSGGGPGGDLLVALAGPLTHLPQYFLWLSLEQLAAKHPEQLGTWAPTVQGLLGQAVQLQVLLVIFNLLVPVYPLDCSKVIISLCRLCGASVRIAAYIMVLLSFACIGALVASMTNAIQLPYLSFGMNPFNMVLILWMAFQTYVLYSSVQSHTEGQHPLLRQSCNSEREELLPNRRDA